MIIHINNYHYPNTTCVITVFCQFFFETGKKKRFRHQIAWVRLRLEFVVQAWKTSETIFPIIFWQEKQSWDSVKWSICGIPWFFWHFYWKKDHGISTLWPLKRVSTLFFMPKYDWENCFGGFSSLDQNSNLNLTPAIWCMNFFFARF